MPLETLEFTNVKQVATELPRRKRERFNPFTDLTREDFEIMLRNLEACIKEALVSSIPMTPDISILVNKLHVLFPRFEVKVLVPEQIIQKQRDRVRVYDSVRDWRKYLEEATLLKHLAPNETIRLTGDAFETLKNYIKVAAVGGFPSKIALASQFKEIWPDRFTDLGLGDDDWKVFLELYDERQDKMSVFDLEDARIVFPEQFKRDIKLAPDKIRDIRKERGDYYAAFFSADDIIVDNTGLHLVFSDEKVAADNTPPPPTKIKF